VNSLSSASSTSSSTVLWCCSQRPERIYVICNICSASNLLLYYVYFYRAVSEAYNRSPWSPPPPPSHNTSCQGRHLHFCHLYYVHLVITRCSSLQLHDSLSMHLFHAFSSARCVNLLQLGRLMHCRMSHVINDVMSAAATSAYTDAFTCIFSDIRCYIN